MTAARQAFVDGMVIGSRVTAVVAVIGALVALKWLPARAAEEVETIDAFETVETFEIDGQPIDTLELVAADR